LTIEEKINLKKMTYTNIINRTLEMYRKGDHLEAYNFITENYKGIKGNLAQIYNFRYSIANEVGLEKLALQIMREAIVEKGFWYQYNYLIEDEDLKSLNKYKEFNELVDICKKRELEAKRNKKPDLKIIAPDKMNEQYKHPLIIALHGDQENIEITEDYWSSCIHKNYLLALPQSSQIQFSEGYEWKDIEKSSRELKEHHDRILEKYNIDSDNIIIGGFSAGGRVALYSILKGIIQIKGFILVAPWLPEIDEWAPLLDMIREKGIKGYVVCGDKDDNCYECTGKFTNLLSNKKISYELKIFEGLDHEYPDNFNEILQRAIEFISES
jgi:predicted esterase